VKPVYLTLAPLLDGENGLYLVVQSTYILAMFFLMTTFAPSQSVWGYGRLQIALCATAITLTCLFFAAAHMPVTSYRVELYRGEWQVIAFTQVVNLYSAWAAICILNALRRTRALTRRATAVKRSAYALITLAFCAGLITVIERVVMQGLASHLGSSFLLERFDGALVVIALLGLTLGLLLLFCTRPRAEQARPARSQVTWLADHDRNRGN
jgi:hypothetical protein